MSPSLKAAVLVTVISETVLQDRLMQLMKHLGVAGYTISQAQGAGSHGSQMGDIAGYKTNIELKTVVSPELADQLLTAVETYKDKFAVIAFRLPVDALL